MKTQTTRNRLCLLITAFLCLFQAVFSTGCSTNRYEEPVSMNGFYFDTAITVTLYDYPGNSSDILDGVNEICKKYDKLLSATIEGSDIWNINHSTQFPIEISAETAQLLEQALYYGELSSGQLDITVGKLVEAWNFSKQAGMDNPVIPSDETIKEIVSHIDYQTVLLETDTQGSATVTLTDPEVDIELGCIAKGFIADRLYDYLTDSGVTSALISLGGNVRVIGPKPDGTPFTIGIQKPFASKGEPITTARITNGSIVTSGIYERYFEKDKTLYHHILNPATGYPVENDLYSISIYAQDSVTADALSTLCFILGPDEGMKLIDSLPDVEALFIDQNYNMTKSSGWPE